MIFALKGCSFERGGWRKTTRFVIKSKSLKLDVVFFCFNQSACRLQKYNLIWIESKNTLSSCRYKYSFINHQLFRSKFACSTQTFEEKKTIKTATRVYKLLVISFTFKWRALLLQNDNGFCTPCFLICFLIYQLDCFNQHKFLIGFIFCRKSCCLLSHLTVCLRKNLVFTTHKNRC